MRRPSLTRHPRLTGPILALVVVVADAPTALAQAPAEKVEGPVHPGTLQLAAHEPPRRRRPVDPAARELRQARGILAGGIVLTTLCGAGFGLFMYAVVDRGSRLSGSSGARTLTAGAALLSCTLASIAGIGVGAHRLRALRSSGRVAWTGGLGFRF